MRPPLLRALATAPLFLLALPLASAQADPGSALCADLLSPLETSNSPERAFAEAWLQTAQEHPGSWWPHWAGWLKAKSGKLVPARDPAKGPLKAFEDAPGSFVRVRSNAEAAA